MLWCHLNIVSAWEDQFKNNPAVAALVSSAISTMHFPNYRTLDTRLTATEVNLLAALTSWCVVSLEENQVLSRLFVDAPPVPAAIPGTTVAQ